MAEIDRRRRKKSPSFDKETVLSRIIEMAQKVELARSDDIELRVQRYAKFRGWTSGMTAWDGSSDASLPDMTSASLRAQDTMINAVLSARPAVNSQAVKKQDQEKQERIDNLLDYQFFVEQDGESILSELTECFINDGNFVAHVPWVKEMRKIQDVRVFPPIPLTVEPYQFFQQILLQQFPGMQMEAKTGGWDWELYDLEGTQPLVQVSFYTNELDEVEMVVKKAVEVYNGPRVLVKNYEDVIAPVTAANLQIPGPSNPGGAQFVILRDYPTIDEVKRLIANGYYDSVSKEDRETLDPAAAQNPKTTNQVNTPLERVKDDVRGVEATSGESISRDKSHGIVERFLVFDTYDIDGDGLAEDVIWWMIREPKMILRVRLLSEVSPGVPPRRPIAEASMLPIKGRRDGIGMLELQEGLHDLIKTVLDTTIDGGSLTSNPFFFYRASSNLKPEIIRLAPGEGYPLANPQQDIEFPYIQNSSQAFGINMISLLKQYQQETSMVGDLQYGKVPDGKAAAFRTSSGMNTLLQQSEARPEHILRNFFRGLADIFALMHRLNQSFLSPGKQFRMIGYTDPNTDPYARIESVDQITGSFDFDFKASLLNSSPMLLQQALNQILSVVVSDLTFAMGIAQPDGVYRLLVDWGKAQGQDITKYITPPTPTATMPRILAEEAVSMILESQFPVGIPLEPPQEHIQKLMGFMQSPNFGLLTPEQVQLFMGYMQSLMMLIQQAGIVQQMGMAAGQMGQMPGRMGQSQQPQSQAGPAGASASSDVLSNNELRDESLPSEKSTQK